MTDPMGQTEYYGYDPKGRLIEKTDREGYLTRFAYTAQGDVSHIRYADGKEVTLSYDPLRRLQEIRDWLGVTAIQSDALGRAERIRYPDGQEISYAYGKSGERTQVTYPDGASAAYRYDSLGRLVELEEESGAVTYQYDALGRLSEKMFPGGLQSSYRYNGKGQLETLTHRDGEGILDYYAYRYDPVGNKTGITRQRRGLEEESGSYTYAYDALNRLTEVARDGQAQRSYAYDAFGSRIRMREAGRETTYTYDPCSRLVAKTDGIKEETYAYDNRGNLRQIRENGELVNRYVYGALNRLEQAVGKEGRGASYRYNGLGNRVGRTEGVWDPGRETLDPEREIRYTIDLTRRYHNLLRREEDGRAENYLWDGNVVGIMGAEPGGVQEAGGSASGAGGAYYLQDELGSPIRLLGRNGALTESYGYDEFGQEYIYREAQNGTRAGSVQPFTFTGYQRDDIAGTYFAQAREYRPEQGRFISEDLVKGNTAQPFTLDAYGYCFGNPLVWVDLDGRTAIDPRILEYGAGTLTRNILSEMPDKEKHHSRNGGQERKFAPYTDEEIIEMVTAENSEWVRQGDNANIYHQFTDSEQGEDAVHNVKYLKKNEDGTSYEIVICELDEDDTSKMYIVDDPANKGTYNFSDPGEKGYLAHFVDDMLPYYLWGNSEDDPTPLHKRIIGAGEGKEMLYLSSTQLGKFMQGFLKLSVNTGIGRCIT